MKKDAIFNLVASSLNKLYCNEYNDAKEELKKLSVFNDIPSLEPGSLVTAVDVIAPKKIKEADEKVNSIYNEDYYVSLSMVTSYTEPYSNYSIAVVLSAKIEILNSKEKTVDEAEELINKNKISFVQPILGKTLNIMSNLLSEYTIIYSVPGLNDVLKDNRENFVINFSN